jgi:hypothetical protein
MEAIMRNTKIIQLATAMNKETAAVQMGDDEAADNILMELYRANKILDKRKQDIFFDHLSMGSKGSATRAISAYDEDYLLRLPLSLASIQELAQQLISAVTKFRLTPSPSWTRIAGGTFHLEVQDADLEDDPDAGPDSERVGADI